MPAATHAGVRKQLDLLVRPGLGIEPVVPELARIVRCLVGAEGCFIGWFDRHGAPEGFFHDSAPVVSQELFLNSYQELFVGPHELTIFWLLAHKCRAVGNMLSVDKAFYKSNTYNLLFKPCHHHFGLDLKIDVNGVTRMVIELFRAQANPFSEGDAQRLHSLTPALQMAVAKIAGSTSAGNQAGNASSRRAAVEPGHLLVSPDGTRITMINEQAIGLLRLTNLFDQGIRLIGRFSAPPRFISQICAQLNVGSQAIARSSLDVLGGSLAMSATWIWPPTIANAHDAGVAGICASDKNILVTIEFQRPSALDVVRNITQLGLSPLQSRIAMFAASGGSRADCAGQHQVSKEALKKHLREIYAASLCADWQELAVQLNAP